MLSTVAAALGAVVLALGANAQDISEKNNVTFIEGTWSTGSGAVSTGGSFCTPAEMKFDYPVNTGKSYSFTEDGFFEEALYYYNSNASNPECIEGVVSFQHGTYRFEVDGGLTLLPFTSDGRIQVQTVCTESTNGQNSAIYYYDNGFTFRDWGITIDQGKANYALKLHGPDGSPLPPMYLIARPPNMLPTHVLSGTNGTGQSFSKRDQLVKRGAGQSVHAGALAATAAGVAVAALSLL